MNFLKLAFLCLATTSACNGNYWIENEIINIGGGKSLTASYSLAGSIGGICGVSVADSPAVIMKTGYTAQLYEIENVDVNVNPATVDECNSSQLMAVIHLDDGSVILPDAASVQWSVVSGPVHTPSGTGEVTTQSVYENSVATLGGSYKGKSDTAILTILDSNPDNYSSYGLDDIDDDWQVFYFGEPPNPAAGPNENPDGDTDDNQMEFLAGFDPTDPSQWLRFAITDKTGTVATLVLNKVIPGRTYTIQAGTDLETFPDTITTLSPSVEELDKVVTDTSAVELKKFYRVDVNKP